MTHFNENSHVEFVDDYIFVSIVILLEQTCSVLPMLFLKSIGNSIQFLTFKISLSYFVAVDTVVAKSVFGI